MSTDNLFQPGDVVVFRPEDPDAILKGRGTILDTWGYLHAVRWSDGTLEDVHRGFLRPTPHEPDPHQQEAQSRLLQSKFTIARLMSYGPLSTEAGE